MNSRDLQVPSVGSAAIRAMMEALRASPPARLGGDDVLAIADYQTGLRTGMAAGVVGPARLSR